MSLANLRPALLVLAALHAVAPVRGATPVISRLVTVKNDSDKSWFVQAMLHASPGDAKIWPAGASTAEGMRQPTDGWEIKPNSSVDFDFHTWNWNDKQWGITGLRLLDGRSTHTRPNQAEFVMVNVEGGRTCNWFLFNNAIHNLEYDYTSVTYRAESHPTMAHRHVFTINRDTLKKAQSRR